MRIDFTWIDFAGEKCLLLTDRNDDAKPICYLRAYELRKLKELMKEVRA